MTGSTKRLSAEWQTYKPNILKLAATKAGLEELLSTVTDDLDEGRLHLFSFAIY
jgi:hypothetical protein